MHQPQYFPADPVLPAAARTGDADGSYRARAGVDIPPGGQNILPPAPLRSRLPAPLWVGCPQLRQTATERIPATSRRSTPGGSFASRLDSTSSTPILAPSNHEHVSVHADTDAGGGERRTGDYSWRREHDGSPFLGTGLLFCLGCMEPDPKPIGKSPQSKTATPGLNGGTAKAPAGGTNFGTGLQPAGYTTGGGRPTPSNDYFKTNRARSTGRRFRARSGTARSMAPAGVVPPTSPGGYTGAVVPQNDPYAAGQPRRPRRRASMRHQPVAQVARPALLMPPSPPWAR